MTTWQDLLRPGEAVDFFSRRSFPPFDPGTVSGYNPVHALWLAELSRLIYRRDHEEENTPPQPGRASFLEKAGLRQRCFFISYETDTQAMLVEPMTDPAFAVLIFRGTEQNTTDIMTDLKFGKPLINQNKPGVHKGFKQALDSVWDGIEDELADLACPVYFTGHSLGAALATLAAARYAPSAVYTFGSPRVGNAAFVTSLVGVAIHRVKNAADIVTHLPPEVLGFRHAGEIQSLIKEKKGHAAGRDKQFFSPPEFLADHAPVNYVDRIR